MNIGAAYTDGSGLITNLGQDLSSDEERGHILR